MRIQKSPCVIAMIAIFPAIAFLSCSRHATPPDAGATPPPLVLAPPQPGATPAPAPGDDSSSPKKAALAFASAMVAGDAARMRTLATGTDGKLFAYYSGLAEMVQAQHILTEALKQRFGDDCQLPAEIEHIGNLPPMPANYDQLAEKIDGDSATLVDSAGHAGVKLKNVDGAWKVDLEAADAALQPDALAGMPREEQHFAAMRKAFDQVAANIIDGKDPDCKAATDDLTAAIGAKP